MSYMDALLEKTNLHHLAEFLQNSGNPENIPVISYEQEEKEAHRLLQESLENGLPPELSEEALSQAEQYAASAGALQFLLGMKAGARLQLQLLTDPDDFKL